jgi:hypothetical protein
MHCERDIIPTFTLSFPFFFLPFAFPPILQIPDETENENSLIQNDAQEAARPCQSI